MSASSSQPPFGPVPPLTCLKADGKPRERSTAVTAEILDMLRLPQTEGIAKPGGLRTETIVFFARQARRADEDLYGLLVQELSNRIIRMVRNRVYGLDPRAAEEIPLKVEIEILELVLAEKPSLDSEFLEVAFGQAVERRTIDAIRKYKRSILGGRRGWIVAGKDEDGDEIERPIELAPDNRPNPEEVLLQLDSKNQRHQLLKKACQAVENKRHLEAFIMHYAHGWPIVSNDPERPDLVSRFNVTEGQMKHWLKKTMEIMREALGVEIGVQR
jgi:hypothetical protein